MLAEEAVVLPLLMPELFTGIRQPWKVSFTRVPLFACAVCACAVRACVYVRIDALILSNACQVRTTKENVCCSSLSLSLSLSLCLPSFFVFLSLLHSSSPHLLLATLPSAHGSCCSGEMRMRRTHAIAKQISHRMMQQLTRSWRQCARPAHHARRECSSSVRLAPARQCSPKPSLQR